MTIEITRKASIYQFRINPYQPRSIDRRINRHGARWKHWRHYPSTMAAIDALFAAQSDVKETSS